MHPVKRLSPTPCRNREPEQDLAGVTFVSGVSGGSTRCDPSVLAAPGGILPWQQCVQSNDFLPVPKRDIPR
jgi:hypothetical protein